MAIIFRKTTKGAHEIETREHRLPPRVRSALILVDGKRDVAALKALMPQLVDGTLEMLLEQAFIEVVGDALATSALRTVPDEGPRTRPAPAAIAPTPAAPASATPGPSFAVRQRTAVREFNDAMGPMGESLAIRMERARDEAELRPLVQIAVQLIGHAHGRSAAEAYAKRHGF